MAKPRMDLTSFVGKLLEQDDIDALREGVRILAQAVMETEDSGQDLTRLILAGGRGDGLEASDEVTIDLGRANDLAREPRVGEVVNCQSRQRRLADAGANHKGTI